MTRRYFFLQYIDVPKISQDRIQQRLVDRDLRHPQIAEQSADVPTVVCLHSSLQQQTAEQFIGIPVSSHLWSSLQRTVEQNVDISVPRTRDGGGLHRFLPWKRTLTFQFLAHVLVEGFHGFHPGPGSSQLSDEENVDIPVLRARENRANPRGFHPGPGSSHRSDE